MTIKYKLGFTIDSETLFGIMAKFLPIQDLTVEELAPMEDRINAKMQALGNALEAKQLKPKRKQLRAPRVSGYAINIYAGVNAVLLNALADGQAHTISDAFPAIREAGYSPNGIYSRLERLVKHGYIVKIVSGMYKLTPKGKSAWAERSFPELKVEDRA